MKNLFSNMSEDKIEDIKYRLFGLNLILNVIFYFIVDSLNNINEIFLFNLITIGSIELFLSKKEDWGIHIIKGFFVFLFTFIIALIICAILNALITGIFKEKGEKFIKSLNIYPADNKEFYFIGSKRTQEEKTKSNPYAKYAMDEELFLQLGLLQTKDIEKSVENRSFDVVLLPSMYTNLTTRRIYCAIMKDVIQGALSREDIQDKDIFKKRDLEIKTECPIYNEIYEKYLYMYEEAVKSQRIPIFYYFASASSESESRENVGMFPTMEECNHYANLFLEKEISLVGKCKKYE